MSKSAGTRKRARNRCTIAMLSPFLPRRNFADAAWGAEDRHHVGSREAMLAHKVTDLCTGIIYVKMARPKAKNISAW
jgi:hypothetical protein